MTLQTSNICNILSPLHHAYLKHIALAVFKPINEAMFDLGLILWLLLWDASTWPEGSYEIGSVLPSIRLPIVCPSFPLPVSFLGIDSLIFSETYGLRCSYIVICDRAGFFWKKNWCQKWSKRATKITLFRKTKLLFLSGINVKQTFLWSFNIQQRLYAWDKSDSQVMAKNGSWPITFQNSLIVNIALTDWYLTLIFGM